MGPYLEDDLSEFDPMDYNGRAYLYHIQFDCGIKPIIADSISLSLQNSYGYRTEGLVMSENSLILSCDREIGDFSLLVFPECKNLQHIKKAVIEHIDGQSLYNCDLWLRYERD